MMLLVLLPTYCNHHHHSSNSMDGHAIQVLLSGSRKWSDPEMCCWCCTSTFLGSLHLEWGRQYTLWKCQDVSQRTEVITDSHCKMGTMIPIVFQEPFSGTLTLFIPEKMDLFNNIPPHSLPYYRHSCLWETPSCSPTPLFSTLKTKVKLCFSSILIAFLTPWANVITLVVLLSFWLALKCPTDHSSDKDLLGKEFSTIFQH